MAKVNKLTSAGQGTAIPAGFIGEVIDGGSSTSSPAIAANDVEIGGNSTGNGRIELTPGLWLLVFEGQGTMSDSTVECGAWLNTVSGTVISATASPTTMGVMRGDAANNRMRWFYTDIIRVTSTAVIRFRSANLNGGTITAAATTRLCATRLPG